MRAPRLGLGLTMVGGAVLLASEPSSASSAAPARRADPAVDAPAPTPSPSPPPTTRSRPPDVIIATASLIHDSGTYGGPSRSSYDAVTLSATYRSDRWSASLSVPRLSVEGPAGVLPSSGIAGAAGGGRRVRAGLGDAVLAGTLKLWATGAGTRLDGGVFVSLGTANATRGLGTGAVDWSGQVTLSHALTPRLTAVGSLGHRMNGRSPVVVRRDQLFGTLSVGWTLPPAWSLGAAVSLAERATSPGAATHQGGFSLSRRVGDRWYATGLLLNGFDDRRVLSGAGFSLARTF